MGCCARRCRSMSARRARWRRATATRCISSTSPRPRRTTASPRRAPSTRRRSSRCPIDRRRGSGSASRAWSASSARSTVRVRSTHTRASSATRKRSPSSGRCGTRSRSRQVPRTPSARCVRRQLTPVRIKRSVQAQYNTELATVMASAKTGEVPTVESGDPMAMLEARATAPDAPAFVSATSLSRPAKDTANAEQVGGAGDDDDLM